MSYFPGIFITQYHKSRAGYFINHDLLINGISELIQPLPKTERNSSSTTSQKMYPKKSTTQITSNINAKGTILTTQKYTLR
jgi:hypothetical protein